MRVAFLHKDLPCGKFGGVTNQVHFLANELARAGHDVKVYTFSSAPSNALYKVEKIGRIENKFSYHFKPPIVYSLQKIRADIIHSHGDDAFVFKKPKVRTFYGSALAEAIYSRSLKISTYQFINYVLELISSLSASFRVACSTFTKKFLPINRVIPCCFPKEIFYPGKKSKYPSVLFVGTMYGRKRGNIAIREFEKVKKEVKKAEMWFVCSDDKSYKYKKYDGITFYRNLPFTKLSELYRRAWIFCSTSSYEGFGVPYIESMASGTAVVTTNNPGAEEILCGGKYGVICLENEIHKNIIRLIENKNERKKLEDMNIEVVQKYRAENVARQYIEIYESLL